jgi:hypothetical protein
MLRRSFQQSALLSVTLTLTFRSLSIPESQFSETWRHKAILRGKGDSGLSYSGIDKIPVSHLILRRQKNAGKSIWLEKAILQIFKPLKMVLCSSCEGVPLKFKNKNGGLQFTTTDYFGLLLTPLRIRWTIPLRWHQIHISSCNCTKVFLYPLGHAQRAVASICKIYSIPLPQMLSKRIALTLWCPITDFSDGWPNYHKIANIPCNIFKTEVFLSR